MIFVNRSVCNTSHDSVNLALLAYTLSVDDLFFPLFTSILSLVVALFILHY